MDQTKFLLDSLEFFSKKRTLEEIIKKFGTPRNSLEADIVSLKPVDDGVSYIEIDMNHQASNPVISNIEFGLGREFAPTFSQLKELFPENINSTVNREQNFHIFHPPHSAFVTTITARGDDHSHQEIMDSITLYFSTS